jgi:hypothetical protein
VVGYFLEVPTSSPSGLRRTGRGADVPPSPHHNNPLRKSHFLLALPFFLCGFGTFFPQRGTGRFGQMRNRPLLLRRRSSLLDILFSCSSLFSTHTQSSNVLLGLRLHSPRFERTPVLQPLMPIGPLPAFSSFSQYSCTPINHPAIAPTASAPAAVRIGWSFLWSWRIKNPDHGNR